ncbi:MAG: DNA/RNA non-specific endonuclease [Flavobacteriales bacterium]
MLRSLFYIGLLITYASCSKAQPQPNLCPSENPALATVCHTAYCLGYNEAHEQAAWIFYEFTRSETIKRVERSDRFLEDDAIGTGSASHADYKGSGYDRGHLAPAADMSWSAETMNESFYYSNMSPQVPSFNRGIWKNLEALVRDWAYQYDTIYIMTGPVLEKGLTQIGPNGVSVPKLYYKAILDVHSSPHKCIGFLLPNAGSYNPLQSFAVSVDQLEQITGIDFYASLPDAEEQALEASVDVGQWSWDKALDKQENQDDQPGGVAVQCSATTKAGTQCKNKTKDPSGLCHVHKKK